MADITATTRKRKVTEVAEQPKAGITVQEYLMGEKTKMVEAIQAHIHSQINKLRNEFELGKIELEQEVERQIAELEKENRVLRQMLRIRYLDSQIMLNKSFY